MESAILSKTSFKKSAELLSRATRMFAHVLHRVPRRVAREGCGSKLLCARLRMAAARKPSRVSAAVTHVRSYVDAVGLSACMLRGRVFSRTAVHSRCGDLLLSAIVPYAAPRRRVRTITRICSNSVCLHVCMRTCMHTLHTHTYVDARPYACTSV